MREAGGERFVVRAGCWTRASGLEGHSWDSYACFQKKRTPRMLQFISGLASKNHPPQPDSSIAITYWGGMHYIEVL